MHTIGKSSMWVGAMVLMALSLPIFGREATDVADNATLVKPLHVGAAAPAVMLRRADGTSFAFRPDKLDQPVVLIFYRGGWCPYCNTHLGELHKVEKPLRELGYRLLFFSADKPELLYSSLKDPSIQYTLLSDSKMTAARAYGVAFRVDDATLERYQRFGIDLEKTSGETHHQLPVPAVFVIDTQGIVRFVHANPDYRVRISNDELLSAARDAAKR
jgi:peroxiredoxin